MPGESCADGLPSFAWAFFPSVLFIRAADPLWKKHGSDEGLFFRPSGVRTCGLSNFATASQLTQSLDVIPTDLFKECAFCTFRSRLWCRLFFTECVICDTNRYSSFLVFDRLLGKKNDQISNVRLVRFFFFRPATLGSCLAGSCPSS